MIGETALHFSVKPTLVGERVTLRPFVPDDLDALRTALRDPEVRRLAGSDHDGQRDWTDADEERIRQWYASRNQQTDRLDLAVVDRQTGGCVGEVVLNGWDRNNHSCTMRIMIGSGGRDRGLGTEAVRLIVGHGFERLALHRIGLEVYAFNPRARRVYEKVGFVAEGVLRHALRTPEGWIDATVMSILADEWARHRGRP